VILESLLAPRSTGQRPTVAVPQAEDPCLVHCLARALDDHLADLLLIGDRSRIEAAAGAAGVSLARAHFLPAQDETDACAQAVEAVAAGRAHVLMKGLVQTATFTRAILAKEHGLVRAGHLISHVAIFQVPSYPKPLLVTDAAINIAPDLETKARMLENAVACARRLGVDAPRVACVAPVETVKDRIPSTVDAQALARMGEAGRFGDARVDGPFGLDVALRPEAAATKGIGGPVAGQADIILLPDLDAANVLYKSLTCLAGARTAAIVVGADAPVVLTSRADDEETKILSLALGVTLARPRG